MTIKTPRWALPLLRKCRYKGAKGGRGSGKSHFFAELLVESAILNPSLKAVCIREIQKSLKYSSKMLIENKISALEVDDFFDITQNEIRVKNADGLIIFQGMQDHTADSIKSLEGFDLAWVEEAQNLSKKSLELLRPTIRKEGSEIWFSWNPKSPKDAVDSFFINANKKDDFILVNVNYYDNPFLPKTLLDEANYDKINNPSSFNHIWLGDYRQNDEALIFADKFIIDEFVSDESFKDYYGLDFGFSKDPTAGIKALIKDDFLFIEYEAGAINLELDKTAPFLISKIPNIQNQVIRADSARPESISYLKRHGLPFIIPAKKGKNSIIEGIEFIKSFKKVIIHPRCVKAANEFRNYAYKQERFSGEILPVPLDENNHFIDALRYAIEPLMRNFKPFSCALRRENL